MNSGDVGISIIDQSFEIELDEMDLKTDEGLQTAVTISLFSDRRVSLEELSPEDTDRAGWFGDMFPDVPGDQIGSRLWLLKREKITNETLSRAEEYAEESLKWMIDDGIATSVTATATVEIKEGEKWVALAITLQKPNDKVITFRYKTKWDTEEIRER